MKKAASLMMRPLYLICPSSHTAWLGRAFILVNSSGSYREIGGAGGPDGGDGGAEAVTAGGSETTGAFGWASVGCGAAGSDEPPEPATGAGGGAGVEAAAGCADGAAGAGSRRTTGLSLAPGSFGVSILTSLDLASASGLARSAVPVSTRGASSRTLSSAAGSDLADSALGGSILAGSLAIGGSSAPG